MSFMYFEWDEDKNSELKREGRPSFEEAILAMSKNGVLIDDVNPVRVNQRIYVVEINGYPHVVPYEIRGKAYRLITVYPSRKFKR